VSGTEIREQRDWSARERKGPSMVVREWKMEIESMQARGRVMRSMRVREMMMRSMVERERWWSSELVLPWRRGGDGGGVGWLAGSRAGEAEGWRRSRNSGQL